MFLYILMFGLQMQSVDNEIVLWEPKTKEQSPGEVRYRAISYTRAYSSSYHKPKHLCSRRRHAFLVHLFFFLYSLNVSDRLFLNLTLGCCRYPSEVSCTGV